MNRLGASVMSQFRMSAPSWALAAVSIMFLAETFFFFYPSQANENRTEPKPPLTIKVSCAHGSGLLRLDFDRDADPKLDHTINLREDLKIWVPRGTQLHFEEDEKPAGTAP